MSPSRERTGERRDARVEVASGGATRRRLLETAVGVVAVGTAGAGAVAAGVDDRARDAGAAEARAAQDGDAADLPLLDVHTHLIPEETLDREPLSTDQLVAWMDENGIDRAVVLALDSPESYPVPASSPWILEQVAAYPDRLLPFCTVDPRTQVFGREPVAELVERYVDRGARGFGELKAGVAIDDARLEPIYERCAEHDLPILVHTDETAMTDAVGLPGLEDALASYPSVDFLVHATGWWSHVAADVSEADLGGYPDGAVDAPGRVPELLAEYDNVYGDLSGPSGWNALDRDEAFAQELLETHHEQLVFGTDYVYPGQEIPQFELFDRFDLEESAWADVRYRNLERVLR